MTRFDQPVKRTDSSPSARDLVAKQPLVFGLTVLLATAAVCVAFALLVTIEGVRQQWVRTIDSVQLSIYLQPQLARADADALRSRIEAMTVVSQATLRTREEAVSSLIDGGLQFLTSRSNPLPDVWVVTLGRASASLGKRSLASLVNETRQTLAALPGVDSVRVDGRWIELLDRQSNRTMAIVSIGSWVVAIGLCASLFALCFLSGKAFASRESAGAPSKQALATIGMLTCFISMIWAAAVCSSVILSSSGVQAMWKPIVEGSGRSGHLFVVLLGVLGIVSAALGQVAARSVR